MTSGSDGACTRILELVVGEARLVLRLRPDPRGSTRALARGGDFALSHLDASPPETIRDRLGSLGKAFASEAEHARSDRAATEALARAVESVLPGASLVTKRRIAVDARVPRWPLRMRSGAPDLARGAIWPFDAETTAMRLGLRRLVLREWLDEEDAARDARWLEECGLSVRRVRDRAESGPIALFASFDARWIDEGEDAHRRACAPGSGWQDAARHVAALLGYPSCCVEAFVRAPMRDDVAMFADLLPLLSDRPSSPRVGWIVGALTLVSHAVCSPTCAATYALATSVLEALDTRHAGFAKAWERLARRVLALDDGGRCFSLDAEGTLADGARVVDAIELVPPAVGDRTFDRVIVDVPSWRGGVASIVDHRLVVRAGEVELLSAGLATDQRG